MRNVFLVKRDTTRSINYLVALSYFHLFSLLKAHLGGKDFADDEGIKNKLRMWLKCTKHFYAMDFLDTSKVDGISASILVDIVSRTKGICNTNFYLFV